MANDNQEPTTVGSVAGKTVKGAAIGAGLAVAAAIGLAIGGVMAMPAMPLVGLAALGGAALIGWAGTTGLATAGVIGGGYALAKNVSKMRGESQTLAQEEERNKMFTATLQAAQADAFQQGRNAGQGEVIAKLQQIQQAAYAEQQANFAQGQQRNGDNRQNQSNYYDERKPGEKWFGDKEDDKSNYGHNKAQGNKSRSNYDEGKSDDYGMWSTASKEESNFAARAPKGAVKPAAIRQQQEQASGAQKTV